MQNGKEDVDFLLIYCSGILDDYYSLSMARQQSVTSLFALMGAFRQELDYTVLSSLIQVIFPLLLIYKKFQKYIGS